MTALCQCGCGKPAPVAWKNDSSRGWVKGEPRPFRRGHVYRGRARDIETVIPAETEFGALTVIGLDRIESGARMYSVRCGCGSAFIVRGDSLYTGATTSCGCGQKGPLRHGHSADGKHSPTYSSWLHMVQRCVNPKGNNFKNYGGRGITVCARWRDSFDHFLADMGDRPEGTSIDRIDNDGNYEPANCRWATRAEQENNKRAKRLAR